MGIEVSIVLWGDQLSPAEVTHLLRLSPARFRTKGDAQTRVNGELFAAKTGMWEYSTREAISSTNLKAHLLHLDQALDGKIAKLLANGTVEKARIFVSAASSSTWEEELDAETLRAVSSIGASLYFTVLFSPEDQAG